MNQQKKQGKSKSRPAKTKRAERRRAQNLVNEAKSKALAPKNLRDKINKKESVDDMNHTLGVRGVDIRSPVHKSLSGEKSDLVVQSAVPNLEITAVTGERPIAYLALGIILKAIKRGLLGSVRGPQNYPFYMFRYLIDAFTSAMQGAIPEIQQAPGWFWEICYSLKKKTVPFKTGHATYSWSIQPSPSGVDQALILGAGPNAYVCYLGCNITGATINGFPILAPVPVYTQALGEDAIGQLWSFFEVNGELGKMHGDPGVAFCDRDTSSFASTYAELGDSFESSTGLKTTIYSERQIDSPLMAKFALYQPQGTAYWRGWQKAGASAGSPCYIGPRFSELDDKTQIRNKTAPIFKFYNFDEFFEQLSLILCQAQEERTKNGLIAVPCPLTSQQTQILLRQTMIPLFNNEMAQDLRLGGAYYLELLPFTVGINGNQPAGAVAMQLPTFFAENIRCCTRLVSEVGKGGIIDYIPILGRPSVADVPQLQNYFYNDNVLLYVAPGPEVAINLIDCSATSAGNTVYLDLSREQLGVLASLWNEWITELSNVLSPLVTVGSEPGIAALSTVVYTNMIGRLLGAPDPVTPNPVQQDKRRSTEIPKHQGVALTHRLRAVGPSGSASDFFQTTADKETTASMGFLKPTWNYLSLMILPCSLTDGQLEDASIQGVQAFNCEPYLLSRSNTGGLGAGVPGSGTLYWPSAYSRHLSAASVDVKAPQNSVNNEYIEGILTMNRRGEGGFFTNIAEIIGEGLGIPLISQAARVVGQVTGW